MGVSRRERAGELLRQTVASVCGTADTRALSGISVSEYTDDPVCGPAARLLAAAAGTNLAAGGAAGRDENGTGGGTDAGAGDGNASGAGDVDVSGGPVEATGAGHIDAGAGQELQQLFERAAAAFLDYYSRPEQAEYVESMLELFESGVDRSLLAEEISKIWAPELHMRDEEILPRWQLAEVKPAEQPVKPEQVLLQLNALYTLPERIPENLEEDLAAEGRRCLEKPGRTVAEYDHPVPLFAPDDEHELVGCMDELEGDIAFEKEHGVLPQEHRVPVLISVSVTHEALDKPTGEWVRRLLNRREYRHLRVLVLTEETARTLSREAVGDGEGLFSVFGAYGRHFTALKYAQLLLEPVLGVTAGFKLDTDEGLRSRELFAATGRSWMETLCHPYWGGRARDWRGREVELGVNEGEYVNSSDIEKLGYENALRTPDVAVPDSWSGAGMFFAKGFAHGRATALYNRFQSVEEGISHPVVKGGGYGITNAALRSAAPFTFSRVGRAEDQQFYFSCLAGGVRGIFHPDLRIAHYKSAVGKAEEKTAASRFLGDMYRLIIFEHLVKRFGVKEELDPMPGVFAGPLARAQAAFSLLLKACEFRRDGNEAAAGYLLQEGGGRLLGLERQIDDGTIDRELEEEQRGWREFIRRAAEAPPEKIAAAFGLQ
jgi:hypothetical protein